MRFDSLRSIVTRRPGMVVVAWVATALVVGVASPNLTRLAAEGQATMLDPDAESRRAAEIVTKAWPDQAYESLAVAVLHREGGLTAADRAFAGRFADEVVSDEKPAEVLRVLGPRSPEAIAKRLVSGDGTVEILAIPLSTSFVSPLTQTAVDRLRATAVHAKLGLPKGLEIGWTGDAVLGSDYMSGVQTSLNRAAAATVLLLLVVLMVVYRSFLLALVPLATIGVSLILARGVLGWLTICGWAISPLVELFLVRCCSGAGRIFAFSCRGGSRITGTRSIQGARCGRRWGGRRGR